jgi:cold shock CspA family protein
LGVNERPKATTRPGKPNQPLPPCGRPTSGRVIRIHAGQSHGFIRDVDSREVFFHRSDTTFGTFNKLIVGDKVAFELIEDRVSEPRAFVVTSASILLQPPLRGVPSRCVDLHAVG